MILIDIIKKLKELNKIVIIPSHIFSTLNDICNEIHLLRKDEQLKAFQKSQFNNLEEEMRSIILGNKSKILTLNKRY